MPPMPPGGIGGVFSFSGISVTNTSVVSNKPAMDAAFCNALRVTLIVMRLICQLGEGGDVGAGGNAGALVGRFSMRVASAGRRLIRFLSRLNQNGAPNASSPA